MKNSTLTLWKKGEPITPGDIAAIKQQQIPGFVFDSFNELIAKHYDGTQSTFLQRDVTTLISEAGNCSESYVYDNRWLDVEAVYERSGWKVEYDKPGFNEDYPARFTFTPKNKR